MINRKLVETPVRMMNRMEEITDLICEYNEEVQKQQQEIERLNNIINKSIEYINNLSNEPNVFGHYGIDSRCKNWLLNILKGNDKE